MVPHQVSLPHPLVLRQMEACGPEGMDEPSSTPPNLLPLTADILKLDLKPGLLSTRPGRNAFHWVHVGDICPAAPGLVGLPQPCAVKNMVSLIPASKLSDWVTR